MNEDKNRVLQTTELISTGLQMELMVVIRDKGLSREDTSLVLDCFIQAKLNAIKNISKTYDNNIDNFKREDKEQNTVNDIIKKAKGNKEQ